MRYSLGPSITSLLNQKAVEPHTLEAIIDAEKRFSAMLEILLNNKSGPLGVVNDFVVKSEYQKRALAHFILG